MFRGKTSDFCDKERRFQELLQKGTRSAHIELSLALLWRKQEGYGSRSSAYHQPLDKEPFEVRYDTAIFAMALGRSEQ